MRSREGRVGFWLRVWVQHPNGFPLWQLRLAVGVPMLIRELTGDAQARLRALAGREMKRETLAGEIRCILRPFTMTEAEFRRWNAGERDEPSVLPDN